MNYQNRALLDLAKLAPRCMGCGKWNEGDVVAAHANHIEKGTALKAPDYAWAALCTLKCHADLDQGSRMTREERRDFWTLAYWKTQDWLWTTGHLVVSVVPQPAPPPSPKPKRPMPKGRKLQSRGFEKSDTPRKIPSRPFPKKAKT